MRRSGWKEWRAVLVILAGAVMLTACGGGGGGGSDSGSGYSGNTQAAVINEQNASEIAQDAYETGDDVGTDSSILAEALATSLNSPNLAQAAHSAGAMNQPIMGNCGGSMTPSISSNAAGTSFSGSMNFGNYCSDDVTINGSMTFSGYKQDTETFSFTLRLNSLTMTVGSESTTRDGSISLTMNVMDPYAPITYTMTMNTETPTGEVCRLEGYKMTVTPKSGYDLVTVEGRYYYGDLGYVDIYTDQDLQVSDAYAYPLGGKLRFVGNGTWATMIFTGGGNYVIDNGKS